MRWFYFVRSSKRVALWTQHYCQASYADDAFVDSVRLFGPDRVILFDCGYPIYSYYAFLAQSQDQQPLEPSAQSRIELGSW